MALFWMVGAPPVMVATASSSGKKSKVTRVPAMPPTLWPAGSVTPDRVKESLG